MVSWKDVHHPQSGGAEVYTLTVLEGLRRHGYQVTWLVPSVAGRPAAETTPGGVHIIRAGQKLTHLLHAWRYLKGHRDTIDLIIDQVNAYPMLTFFTVPPERGLVLIHQLTREVWFYEVPKPVALLGYLLEPLLLRLYRHRLTVTVSESTAADLRAFGLRRVTVVENALPFTLPAERQRQRPGIPHYVGLGRLVRMKRFEHLLEAFRQVKKTLPDARLTIMGRGKSRYAQQLARHIHETPDAELIENAPEEIKHDILGAATAVVGTSVREGWGLMITEGHAFGTPSIAYRLPGLQDSTRHGIDGLLVEPDPKALARAMLELHQDPLRWQHMSRSAYQKAAELTTARLTDGFREVVAKQLEEAEREVDRRGS
jgi:glycosyltransferase involved in cell wall biosynthesis